jgi:cobalamin synthase
MLNNIRIFLHKLNEKGVPLPMMRDPRTGLGSVSLTMLFISFNVVLLGLIGKWSKLLDIDVQQAIYWFMVCAGLYFSRTLSKDGNNVQLQDINKDNK